MQADSLGYVLFKQGGFNSNAYLSTLELVENHDYANTEKIKKETYKKLFHLPKQSFKEKWLEMEDFSTYNYANYKAKIDEDSIKTHPEMMERIKNLKQLFPELNKEIETKIEPSEEYKNLAYISQMQMVPNLFDRKYYGLAVYYSISHLQKENFTAEEQVFYKQWLGKNFKKIYQARLDYTLNRYLDKIDNSNKEQTESYKQFLSFMWNLNLDEIKNIADYYSHSY